jgi:hypothetical protein
MLEYCLGLGWGATAVGLFHYLTISIFRTIEIYTLWPELGWYVIFGQ